MISDAPDNWLQIRLIYADGESVAESIQKRLTVDRLTLHKAVQMDDTLGLWNIEWAIKPVGPKNKGGPQEEFLALRTQPSPSDREYVKGELTSHARDLVQKGLIRDFKFDNRTWLQTMECPEGLESWDEWFTLLRMLNHLSKAVHEVQSLRRYSRMEHFLHERLVHHAHNMMHLQDESNPRELEQKVDGFERALLMHCPWLLTSEGIVSWRETDTMP